MAQAPYFEQENNNEILMNIKGVLLDYGNTPDNTIILYGNDLFL